MAANGKIDIGCGMLEYTINWPKVTFFLWLPSPFNHSGRCLSTKFLPALVHDYLHQNPKIHSGEGPFANNMISVL